MAYDADEVEEKFDKFMESIEQYSNEPVDDLATLKPHLLDIFKTHHPIKIADIKHGLSKTLEENSQIIIHHFKNDRSLVREYFKAEDGSWKCCECTRTRATAENNDDNNDIHVEPSESTNDVDVLLVERGIIFTKNDHYCEPRLLSYMYKIQKYYKEKKKSLAIALQKKKLGTEDAPFIPVKQKRVVAGKKKVEEAKALQKDVLNSEDLNVVSSKQKAAKRGTKASSSEPDELINAEARVRYAQLQEKDSQENRPSISDERYDEFQEKLSPQDAFTKIIENLEEYTNESKEAVMANKSKLLSCLKTHRPVKIGHYTLGFSETLEKNHRLIIFEWNDERRVREYSKATWRKNIWRCRECYRRYSNQKQDIYLYTYLVSGITFVPNQHDCPPRDYQKVLVYQKCLEDGDSTKAKTIARKDGFLYEPKMKEINRSNVPSISSLPKKTASTENKSINDDKSNSKTLTNSKLKMVSDGENDACICLDEKSPVHKKSKINQLAYKDTVRDYGLLHEEKCDEKATCENTDGSFEMSEVHPPTYHTSESPVEMEEVPSTSIATPSIYHFEKPSTSKLQEICGKLKILYRNHATKFWKKIKIEMIDTLSTRIQLHSFKRNGFYQILSLFFTGKSKQHEQIKATIIDAFREKMVSSGEVSTKKFNKRYLDTVTDEHFTFIAKYLSCRILIFDGENGIHK